MSNTTPKSEGRLTTLLAMGTLIALSSLLAACGGGSGSAEAAPEASASVEYVPAAASDGVTAFAGWLKQMSTEVMDGKEAMDTSTFAPTVQDDTEPVAVPL